MILNKCCLLLLVLLFGPLCSFAQKQNTTKIKGSQILITMSNGININSANVSNNEVHPNPIRIPSKLGYAPGFALEYQRITSAGLMFGGGFTMGSYHQNFDVVYESFDFLDTTQELKEAYAQKEYRNKSIYAGIRIFIGYTWPIKSLLGAHSYHLETKLGLNKTFLFSGGQISDGLTANYTSNDTIYLYRYTASLINVFWGNSGRSFAGPLIADFYLGLRRNIDWHLISNINFGVFGTFYLHKPGLKIEDNAEVSVLNGHYLNGELQKFDIDYYTTRGISFGVKIGMGLKL